VSAYVTSVSPEEATLYTRVKLPVSRVIQKVIRVVEGNVVD